VLIVSPLQNKQLKKPRDYISNIDKGGKRTGHGIIRIGYCMSTELNS
jgi:hypothetical protein